MRYMSPAELRTMRIVRGLCFTTTKMNVSSNFLVLLYGFADSTSESRVNESKHPQEVNTHGIMQGYTRFVLFSKTFWVLESGKALCVLGAYYYVFHLDSIF